MVAIALFWLPIDMAISGSDTAVPTEKREYVQAIRAEPDAAGKLRIYSAALRSIQERLAPLFRGGLGCDRTSPDASYPCQSGGHYLEHEFA